jgi:NAD(P)-dependent dehydrogenase (short-subunit alcohol dehydrogenase family)
MENRQCNRNVVNVSSIAALHIYPSSGQSLYGASKAAFNHVTGYMAQELAPIGIRVNATAPNSFPAIVSTERAALSIRTLDEGADTGTVVVVDGERDEVIKLY